MPLLKLGCCCADTTWKYAFASAPVGPVSLDPLRAIVNHATDTNRTFLDSSLLLGAEAAPSAHYEVTVTNTGQVDSDDAVLGFLKPPGAGTGGVPLQVLFGFNRVFVQAGQSVTVGLYPSVSAAAHFAVLSAKV